LQNAALGHYRRSTIFNTRNGKNFKEIEIIKAYFRLFDHPFFGGGLCDYGEIKLKPKTADDVLGLCEEMSTWAEFFDGKTREVKFLIKIWTINDMVDERERRLDQLGTMVHEMIHAYFAIYACH
jgi:hypothetical protein